MTVLQSEGEEVACGNTRNVIISSRPETFDVKTKRADQVKRVTKTNGTDERTLRVGIEICRNKLYTCQP